jgi:hypothetical protein
MRQEILQEIKTFEASLEKDLELYIGVKKDKEARYCSALTQFTIADYRGYQHTDNNGRIKVCDIVHYFSVNEDKQLEQITCLVNEHAHMTTDTTTGWDNIKAMHYGLDSILIEAELRDLLFTLEHIDWLKKEIGYTNPAELPF